MGEPFSRAGSDGDREADGEQQAERELQPAGLPQRTDQGRALLDRLLGGCYFSGRSSAGVPVLLLLPHRDRVSTTSLLLSAI